jgi:hypothetical protein
MKQERYVFSAILCKCLTILRYVTFDDNREDLKAEYEALTKELSVDNARLQLWIKYKDSDHLLYCLEAELKRVISTDPQKYVTMFKTILSIEGTTGFTDFFVARGRGAQLLDEAYANFLNTGNLCPLPHPELPEWIT